MIVSAAASGRPASDLPGLAAGALDEDALAITIDYRDILGGPEQRMGVDPTMWCS
jgi:hypothetical protein